MPPMKTPSTDDAGRADIERHFRALRDEWKAATRFLSDSAKKMNHPAYQRIIGLGPAVVPMLLAELKRDPDWWDFALMQITGVNPVPPEACGRLELMAKAWLEWAAEERRRADVLRCSTPANSELLRLAESKPPPPEWFDCDELKPF